MKETRRDGPEKSLLQLRAAGEREEGELEKAQEKELCTKPGSRPGLCPPRGQAIKGADPQGWSAEGGEAEEGRLR